MLDLDLAPRFERLLFSDISQLAHVLSIPEYALRQLSQGEFVGLRLRDFDRKPSLVIQKPMVFAELADCIARAARAGEHSLVRDLILAIDIACYPLLFAVLSFGRRTDDYSVLNSLLELLESTEPGSVPGSQRVFVQIKKICSDAMTASQVLDGLCRIDSAIEISEYQKQREPQLWLAATLALFLEIVDVRDELLVAENNHRKQWIESN